VNVFQDRSGTIWAGTTQGLDRLDGDCFVSIARQSHKYTGVAGDDASDSVYAFSGRAGVARVATGVVTELPGLYGEMMLAHGNELWFTGPSGIQRMAADRLRIWDPERDGPLDYAIFGRADGMKTAESAAGVPPLTITPDEKLWVATRQGLAMIDLRRMVRTTAKPVTFIGAITVDRRTLPPARELVLAPGPHHVEVEFDSIELTSPERTRLQYRLDNVDAVWFDAGPIHTAVYTSIPIGKHQFHVRATNRDGVWDREGIVYWIHQQPHYYETTAFRVALVATGFFLLAGLYQLRLRQAAARLNAQLEGKLAERERIACELHDTLLQGFLSASMHVHIAAGNLPVDSQAKPTLTRALQLMGQVIEEGRNAVRGLRSSSSSSLDLEHAFSPIQRELDPQEQVEFRVIVEGQRRPLHPVVRDEMYRIGREALINAFRHSRAKTIEIDLIYSSSRLRIVVRDDGCGIDPQILQSGRDGHWGLSGIRERADRIGARFNVSSGAAAGTEIELSIPGHIAFQDQRDHKRRWFGKQKAKDGTGK